MYLRVKFREPISTGAPDFIICNQASQYIDRTNLAVTVKMGGVDIFSTNDLSTFNFGSLSFPISVNSDIDLLDITIENSDVFKFDLDVPEIYLNTTFEIAVSKAGYIPYTNSFRIYGYDLGNNSLAGVTTNSDFEIHLVPEANNVVNGEQTKAYSRLIGIPRPYTSELYLYAAASFMDSIVYMDSSNNIISIGANGIVSMTNSLALAVKQKHTVHNDSGGIQDECISSVVVFPNLNYQTTFDLSNVCSTCQEICTNIGEESTAKAVVDYSKIPTLNANDLNRNLYEGEFLTYELISASGTVIGTESFFIDTSAIPVIFDPDNSSFTYSIDEIGDYFIRVTLRIDHINEGLPPVHICYKVFTFKGCYYLQVTNTDCREYILNNWNSSEQVSIVVKELQADKTFLGIESFTISPLGSRTLSLSNDGIFLLEHSLEDEVVSNIVITEFCGLKDCIASLVQGLVCSESKGSCCDSCKAHKDNYDFLSLITVAHTFFSHINKEYNFSSIFSVLSPSRLDDLYDMKVLIERMAKYCSSCSSNCNCSK